MVTRVMWMCRSTVFAESGSELAHFGGAAVGKQKTEPVERVPAGITRPVLTVTNSCSQFLSREDTQLPSHSTGSALLHIGIIGSLVHHYPRGREKERLRVQVYCPDLESSPLEPAWRTEQPANHRNQGVVDGAVQTHGRPFNGAFKAALVTSKDWRTRVQLEIASSSGSTGATQSASTAIGDIATC